MLESDNFYLFTSIPPHIGVGQLENLKHCIDSWRLADFKIVAVSGSDELSRIAALELDVELLPIPANGRPRIADILSCISDAGCRHAGIINADCALLPYPELSGQLKKILDHAIIYVERIDLDKQGVPQPGPCGGFDAFFFDTAILPKRFDDHFHIGAPWWDYCFPMAAAACGARFSNLESPLITHRWHEPTWIHEQSIRFGQIFWRFLKDWRSSDQQDFRAISPRVEVFWGADELSAEQLAIVGSDCFKWLLSRRLDVPLRFFSPPMISIETLLGSYRVALNELNQKLAAIGEDNRMLKELATADRVTINDLNQRIASLTEENYRLLAIKLRKWLRKWLPLPIVQMLERMRSRRQG
jgi:hypothetical protein